MDSKDNSQLGPDPLSEFEQSLRALRPTSRLDRDQTFFRAGQAAAQGPRSSSARFGWPAVAAVMGLIVLGETTLLVRRPPLERQIASAPSPPRTGTAPSPVPHTPAVTAAADPAAPTRFRGWPDVPGPSATDRLAWQLARYGLDALPASLPAAIGGRPPLSATPLTQPELEQFLNPGGPT